MTTHGSIDHYFVVPNWRHMANEVFVTLHNFLTSANAQALGIQKVADNYGAFWNGSSYTSAGGMGYWDGGDAQMAGHNAWACFRFGAATNTTGGLTPMYVFIQAASGSVSEEAFGAYPGGFGRLQATTASLASSSIGVGIAYAIANGESAPGVDTVCPWNGTKLANGADKKGDPVWTLSDSVMVFPRSNVSASITVDLDGRYAHHKENTLPLLMTASISGSSYYQNAGTQIYYSGRWSTWPSVGRMHVIATQCSLTVLVAAPNPNVGYDPIYRVSHFGRFKERSGSVGQAPYWYLNTSERFLNSPMFMSGWSTNGPDPLFGYTKQSFTPIYLGNNDHFDCGIAASRFDEGVVPNKGANVHPAMLGEIVVQQILDNQLSSSIKHYAQVPLPGCSTWGATTQVDEFPFYLLSLSYLSNIVAGFGLAGTSIDMLQIYGAGQKLYTSDATYDWGVAAQHDTNTALSRAVFLGTGSVAGVTVAWDGATVPGTTMNRLGVQF